MTHTSPPVTEDIVAAARRVLDIEARALDALSGRLGEDFAAAVRLVLDSTGRVIVSGLGKSGHIARKIAATMASTGTPAYFVHAAEALHGDLGMIHRDDVLIALSNSGETAELLAVVPLVRRQGGRTIAMTGKPDSTLARLADVHLDAGVAMEACSLNLAPTASTTCALALGDALAVALLDARGFREDDFARSHPGGALGRRLLTHVRDVMRARADVPTVAESGVPGFEFNFWVGMLAPAKTPRDIVNKLNAEVAKILQQPEVRDRMAKLGAEAMPMSPEQFDAYLKDEFNTLGAVMRAAGTKAQ